MSDVHFKGRILQIVEKQGPCWDYEVSNQIIKEYGLRDKHYFQGLVRLSLIDLAAGGLIASVEESIDDAGAKVGPGKLLFRYEMTDFGRGRMRDTGLLQERG